MVILNTNWKNWKSRKKLFTKNFTYPKKIYVHEIATVNLSKIYFLKNAKKTCKPNKRDLNRDWIKICTFHVVWLKHTIRQNSFPYNSYFALTNLLQLDIDDAHSLSHNLRKFCIVCKITETRNKLYIV